MRPRGAAPGRRSDRHCQPLPAPAGAVAARSSGSIQSAIGNRTHRVAGAVAAVPDLATPQTGDERGAGLPPGRIQLAGPVSAEPAALSALTLIYAGDRCLLAHRKLT